MDFLMGLFLLFLISAVVFAVAIAASVDAANNCKQIKAAIGEVPDFTSSFQYVGADGNSAIAIDEERSQVCLFVRGNESLTHRAVDYRDILSAELFEDGNTVVKTVRSSQVGGALLGGLLLGGVGAVIGGLSGKKVEAGMVSRIDLRLVVNDPASPTHDVCFLANGAKRDSFLYKTASAEARQWQARMDVLIKRADAAESIEPKAVQRVTSVPDELRKLAELRSDGIITESEFETQKARLLS